MEAILIWSTTLGICLLIVLSYIRVIRSNERRNREERQEAVSLGIHKPLAQHPHIDLALCIGCGACIRACPEGDVLGLLDGKATLINGMRCIGHGLCAKACPVEAVHIGMGSPELRDDIPLLSPEGETTLPGVYIAGELGGLALIKNAILQGSNVAHAIAHRLKDQQMPGMVDVLIVGAGPAGLSTALAAHELGLSSLVLDQNGTGGTILQYPRKKLVLTQPVTIPGHGLLNKPEYSKEELLDIFQKATARAAINIQEGLRVQAIHRVDGLLEVHCENKRYQGRSLVLALGRRGSPRRLGVPGEDLAKVMYSLMDAAQYQNEDLLVVGGGDSAVEAAMALSLQPGNRVTLSYRKHKFFRIKKRNSDRLAEAIAQERLEILTSSQVISIHDENVILETTNGSRTLANNYVFIFAGGIPPFALLKEAGIAFGGPQEVVDVVLSPV